MACMGISACRAVPIDKEAQGKEASFVIGIIFDVTSTAFLFLFTFLIEANHLCTQTYTRPTFTVAKTAKSSTGSEFKSLKKRRKNSMVEADIKKYCYLCLSFLTRVHALMTCA